MCGRYVVLSDEESLLLRQIIQEINRRQRLTRNQPPVMSAAASADPLVREEGDIYPTQMAAVLREEGPYAMRWGFERAGTKGVVINARAETADTLPMFAQSVRYHRCLIPASGFYEWSHTQKPPLKHIIRYENHHPMMMAGIYTPTIGDAVGHFAIVTHAANEDMRVIHDRMPLLLPDTDMQKAWLTNASDALDMLKHPPVSRVQVRAAQPEQLSFSMMQ